LATDATTAVANAVVVAIVVALAGRVIARLPSRALGVLIGAAIFRTIETSEAKVADASAIDTLAVMGAIVRARNERRTHNTSVPKVAQASLVLACAMI